MDKTPDKKTLEILESKGQYVLEPNPRKETVAETYEDIPQYRIALDLSDEQISDLEKHNIMLEILVDFKNHLGLECLAKEVDKTILKLKEKYLNYNDTETMINVIFYVDSLMKLADAGYFITEKNREQTYINIIESADEELIEVLEDYLLINDEISMIKWNKKEYLKKMKTLKELDENSEEFKKFAESIQ